MSRTRDALKKAEAERAAINGESGIQGANKQSPPDIDAFFLQDIEEQCRRIHTSIVARRRIQTIMIVGTDHGDGVTTVASLFARELAKSRTVLMVDANLRTPALNGVFHLPRNEGFVDFLAGRVSLEAAVAQTQIPNLSVMTSGSAPFVSPELFQRGPFGERLAALKDHFDYTIFDAAPLGSHLDAICLAGQVDGVILVVKAESTQVATGKEIKKTLLKMDAAILGVVINRPQDYVPKFLRRLLS